MRLPFFVRDPLKIDPGVGWEVLSTLSVSETLNTRSKSFLSMASFGPKMRTRIAARRIARDLMAKMKLDPRLFVYVRGI